MNHYVIQKSCSDSTVYSGDGTKIGEIKRDSDGFHPLIDGRRIYDPNDRTYLCSSCLMGARKLLLEHADPVKKETKEDASSRNIRFLPETDRQFYPTPSWLAGKMIGKINWKGVKTVLEPSAGKGDILDCLLKTRIKTNRRDRDAYSYHLKDEIQIDAIEIDPDLRHILKDKEYRIVGDDFLSFRSAKAYDAILMNPPFSEGADHLLKAIRFMNRGGQIVCILNAETIRNPYSLQRKELQKMLKKYNASVEILEHAFKKANRQTDVTLTIVSLTIPVPEEKESHFWSKMKKATEKQFVDEGRNELITGSFIDQAILHYQTETNAAYAFFKEYNALSGNLLDRPDSEYAVPLIQLSIAGHTEKRIGTNEWNSFVKNLRMKYWGAMMDRPELTRMMTSDIQKTYQSEIIKLAEYEFTRFNIQQVIDSLSVSMKDGLEESLLKLFDDLSGRYAWYRESQNTVHYYNGWATNKAWKVGMKAIIPIDGYRSYSYGKEKHLDSWRINGEIRDLEQALTYLDYGTTAGVLSKWDISSATEAAERSGQKVVDYTYFSATFHKKGTCHIKFHPEAQKLVDRLNIFVGKKKNWLPPSYGKKHYEDMDETEKAVIDEFEGKDSYEEMMKNPEDSIPRIGSDSLLRIEAA